MTVTGLIARGGTHLYFLVDDECAKPKPYVGTRFKEGDDVVLGKDIVEVQLGRVNEKHEWQIMTHHETDLEDEFKTKGYTDNVE